MNFFTPKSLFAAVLLLSSVSASAQNYITASPDGGFDLSKGKDYVVIYAPNEAIAKMGNNIASNQNLDATQEKNSFLYWLTDWDKTALTMINYEEDGVKNPYGGDDFLNMTPLYFWGTGQFTAKEDHLYDLSGIDDSYILHIDLRDGGNTTSTYKFQIGNIGAKNGHFDLAVNLDLGSPSGDFVGVGQLPHDKNWYSLDIPVKDLIDESDDALFGFDLSGFVNNITTCFMVGFLDDKHVTTSEAKGKLLPDDEVQTYTITKLNSALSLGSVFFYKPDTSITGISHVEAAGNTAEVVYDVAGRRTEMNRPGLYIVKTANGTKKVLKK